MNRSLANRPVVWLILSFCSTFLSTTSLYSQLVSVGSDYVAAFVNTDQRAGRFWISSGSKNGNHRFLFHSDKSVQRITSNVVFRISRGSQVHYFCNTTPDFALGGRPIVGFQPVQFRPYDSIRVAPDTIEVLWKNLDFYDITMRFVVEKPRTIYDDGADILLEFDYALNPNAPAHELGIFLMLDGDNGAALEGSGGGTGGDYSSIMTSNGYYVSSSNGKVFRNTIDTGETFPEFYHVGIFDYTTVPNEIMPIHRLRGFSNGGAPLTRPDVFAVGNWKIYRSLAFDPYSVERVGDVATAMQWAGLGGVGRVRTAFGSNSRAGNNLYHCRDTLLFADIRAVRLIEQKEEDGEFVPSKFAVDMWLSNTGKFNVLRPAIRLVTPVLSTPGNTERAILDPSTPQVQISPDGMLPGMTRKFRWYLNLNPASQDTLIHLQFEIQRTPGDEWVPFRDACSPLITVRPFKFPPCDTMAPVIERVKSGRDSIAYWDLQTYDRHTGFEYDTGIDTIGIISNDGDNFRLKLDPESYNRCDVSETVRLRAEVIDTSKHGRIVFWVRDCQKDDCKGNVSIDSILYSPRPDPYTPTISLRDSSNSWDQNAYPCNARIRTVEIVDAIHQSPNAGDYGLGKVEIIWLQNFKTPVITDERGGSSIRDFDSRATIMLEVDDTLSNAEAQIRVVDYAGNDTVLYFNYCTIDDFLPPKVKHDELSSTTWEVDGTDSAEWDRGLFEVIVVSNLNKNIGFVWPDGSLRDSMPEVTKGAKEFKVIVEVVDKCDSAEVILEFRDTYYSNNAENHRRFDTIRYYGIPDKEAPNIIPSPGFDGNTYTFDYAVNDIHYINGELFECDRGLRSVTVTYTSNVRIRSGLAYANPMEASISFEIIDTMLIDRTDTICVTAVDSAGNVSSDCAYWPSAPDGKSPIFIGTFDRATMAITGVATDNRQNDRGLGSVTLRNGSNLDNTFGLTSLRGKPLENVTIDATDPDTEIAGEIIVQDLYGEIMNSPENSIHTIVIPFRLPVARLDVIMPELVEAQTDFEVKIVALNDVDGDLVQSINLELQSTGPATYLSTANPQPMAGAFSVLPLPGGRFSVRYDAVAGERITAGDVLGSLRFHADLQSTSVEPFLLEIVPGSETTNEDQSSVIIVRKAPNDPFWSQLTLPAPLLRMSGDSLTYINGDCNRVLGSAGAQKPSGVAILAIEPQPIRSDRDNFTAILRGITAEGGEVEWVSPDGRRVGHYRLQGNSEEIGRYTIPVPSEAQAGVYFLRIVGKDGTDSHQIIIIE